MIHHRLFGLRLLALRVWTVGLCRSILCGAWLVGTAVSAWTIPGQGNAQPAPASGTAQGNSAQPTPVQAAPAKAATSAQTPSQTPVQNPPPTPPTQQTPNPFENVPQQQNQPTNPANGPTNPANGVQEAKPTVISENTIEAVEFRGQRRVPQDTLRALVEMKKGDPFDEEIVHRDFVALWNTGRFDDLRVERERGPQGGIVLRFVVTERRTIHNIDYTGNKSITKSEILDRFKERKVALSPESQYDPGKVQRAKNVLQEYESERGHQYASVKPELRQVPPNGVDVNFNIDEGPKVKVGQIIIDGNNAFSDKQVIRAMKNLKPIGIPHSILFENLFARTYDATKLDEDSERIRQFYQGKGYFTAHVVNHSEKVYDVEGKGMKIPLFNSKKTKKFVDVTMVVAEGKKYYLRNFHFVGMKLFRTPDLIARQVFGMSQGDVFSTEKLQKGLDNLRKLYGNFGYIDFVPSPDPEVVEGQDQVDLTIDVDEGHQFFVRRIDFQGNTSTRDKVMRREILIDEGDLFSNQLWETSILRLNQLGFFEALKPEDAADIKRDTKTNTVDLLLKVKERGKNSIQLNGGVSGISGSFIGFTYSTNNFLGLGETLSLSSQLGNRLSSVTLGFTEPYLFDRPIQAGFTVFYQRYKYNQAQEASILAGQNLVSYYNQFGSQNLLNYTSNGKGFTTFISHQLRRSFARVGITYTYNVQTLSPLTTSATAYFSYLDFQGVGGPNSLSGITTSMVTPTFAYNTVNHPITPTHGLRINMNLGVSGSVLGGNVNTFQPSIDTAYFRKGLLKNHVMGFHLNGRFISGYGGKVAPPYSRFYMGGEDDIRGFDIYTISPFAYIPTTTQITVYNSDGTQRIQKGIDANGNTTSVPVTQTVPIYQLITPGGDTSVVFNYEYRIPIFGPVTLAPFMDAGVDRLTLPSQLGLNPGRVDQLNAEFPQADFGRRARIVAGSQVPRMSTGLELQVLMPVVNAPFRVYWAYNPSYLQTTLQPPIVADRSSFPNAATYDQALTANGIGLAAPYHERHSQFRFSIGRTF